jgi:DNA-binding transcriptional regulator GbsR (MarR family)
MDSTFAEKPTPGVKLPPTLSRLNPAEIEAIQLFVRFAAMLGQPRSVAEIYGLLFMSEKPVTMDTLIERLEISKGSVSQGLKYLQDLGAVRTVYVAADRKTYYEAIAELRRLAGRFLNHQIQTHFESSSTWLDGIAAQTQSLPASQRKHAQERLELLRRWERTGRNILPMVLTMLGGV